MFIDNVRVQVVERHLLDPLENLVKDATRISKAEFYALCNEREMEELDKGMEKFEIMAESL
jgi:nitrate/nitrite-specific signal transduction histidine kinase